MSPTTPTNSVLDAFISQVETQIILPIITLLALIAFVVFVWGVVEYIRNADNDEARAKGQQHILWGIVGIVIIFGSSAIIALIQMFVNVI